MSVAFGQDGLERLQDKFAKCLVPTAIGGGSKFTFLRQLQSWLGRSANG
jgi:hypothetical protein